MYQYVLFEQGAVEKIAGSTNFQSLEFNEGKKFVDCIRGSVDMESNSEIFINKDTRGLIFSSKRHERKILVFDLLQSQLLQREKNDDELLLVFQKVFRTAIRIWNKQPFTFSERIHETKSIIFPFAYTDRRRIVIERAAKCDRLEVRNIEWPLLVYKFGVEDAPRGEEIADVNILKKAGGAYVSVLPTIISHFQKFEKVAEKYNEGLPLFRVAASSAVSGRGFRYLNYLQQLECLTSTQKRVVEDEDIHRPIRIDGPAGTGKTASMILRAYKILLDAKERNEPLKIVFFAHNTSTNEENINSFHMLDCSEDFISEKNNQSILFTTLYDFCIKTIKLNNAQVIDSDALEAKQSQRIFIEEALESVLQKSYKTYKPLLSKELVDLFENHESRNIVMSMLQHEFGVQIKGRTDCSIEEYYKLEPIPNGLPIKTQKDKDFIFLIFSTYQKFLQDTAVYDSDDIIVQALAQWNAPFWRREREERGYDYIFVDEMHLFNKNEQYAFHYLTKHIKQKNIPICFALDYAQAIGDRGDTSQDYIESSFGDTDRNYFKTVFRSSQQITDFCAAISSSGTLIFQTNYRDPYDTPTSSFTDSEESLCDVPILYMYPDESTMMASIKNHVEDARVKLHCKYHDIAIITFEESMLDQNNIELLSKAIGVDICLLGKNIENNTTSNNSIILSSPYDVNGLEFKCVILVGVDQGRVPRTKNVDDISHNYIKYIAYNQLYLTSSRAKYRLILLGNLLHGESPCLSYALERGCLKNEEKQV